ncbi:hypothetical protein DCF50_p1147 [Dehalobacter sp. CF]|nr:hypothetical protein DCF50_p1147 [Dehalobacter sp. CF]
MDLFINILNNFNNDTFLEHKKVIFNVLVTRSTGYKEI